jgi:hypothetical protein
MEDKEIIKKLEKILAVPSEGILGMKKAEIMEKSGSFGFACLEYASVGATEKALEMAKKFEGTKGKFALDYNEKVMLLACYIASGSKENFVKAVAKYDADTYAIKGSMNFATAYVPLRLFDAKK